MEQKNPVVPSVDQFKLALVGCKSKLAKSYRAMLEAHYRSPGHQISVKELAKAAGWDTHEGVNIHYGNVGKYLAQFLGMTSPMKNEKGEPVWTGVLATGNDGNRDAPNYIWTMRPELVDAFTQLPWGFTKPLKDQPKTK